MLQIFFLSALALYPFEFGIVPALGQQLGMAAMFDNAPLVKHDNLICVARGAHPMGYQ